MADVLAGVFVPHTTKEINKFFAFLILMADVLADLSETKTTKDQSGPLSQHDTLLIIHAPLRPPCHPRARTVDSSPILSHNSSFQSALPKGVCRFTLFLSFSISALAETRGAECWVKKQGACPERNIFSLDATLDVSTCLRCQLLQNFRMPRSHFQ